MVARPIEHRKKIQKKLNKSSLKRMIKEKRAVLFAPALLLSLDDHNRTTNSFRPSTDELSKLSKNTTRERGTTSLILFPIPVRALETPRRIDRKIKQCRSILQRSPGPVPVPKQTKISKSKKKFGVSNKK
jgi:hypothetical protein